MYYYCWMIILPVSNQQNKTTFIYYVMCFGLIFLLSQQYKCCDILGRYW